MSKTTKLWLVVAASLVLIGCIILGGVMAIMKWDFTKLSTSKYETNNYEIGESYSDISVVANTADIVFAVSEDSKCAVTCYEQKNVKHSVSVTNDTLVIEVVDTRKWYEHIGINVGAPKVTVYMPQGEYGALSVISETGAVEIAKDFTFASIDISETTGIVTNYASALGGIKIKTTTGSIRVEGISAEALELSVSTGKVTVLDTACEGDVTVGVSTGKANLTNVTCKNLVSNGSTGDLLLKGTVAAERFSLKRSTGDINFDRCDAAEITVITDTGSVTGTLCSDKIFIPSSDTGKIDVPKTVTGGRCEISTDTGNIKIEIVN